MHMRKPGSDADPKKVLVVDDELDIREMLQEFLSHLGYQVFVVETGREALDLAIENGERFDAALVDWTLPGIEGRDVVSQLHIAQPDCRLFAITGHSDETVTTSSAGPYVLEVFTKPFSLRKLARALSGHLEKV